ncbi:MAG: diguanylate cyclase, partial [Betaproteobacteria bacterium]|nr:diguanylate cyclase [Betaproteobacteria bacterium]
MKSLFDVLIIEDSPADYLLLRRQLERRGVLGRCLHVDDDQALEQALREPWDAVLTDYHLPGMDIARIVRMVRAADPLLPVLLVSGSIGEERAVELLRAGLTDFVAKDAVARIPEALARALQEASDRRELQQAHAALAASEHKFRSLFDSTPCGLLGVDRESGTVLQGNRRARQMLGEVVGRSLDGIVHEQDLPALARRRAHAVAADAAPLQLRLQAADEHWFWAECDIAELAAAGEGEAPAQWVLSVVDITERKLAEDELRISSIAFESQEGLVVLDAAGNIQRVNQAFTAITGHTQKQACEESSTVLLSTGGDDALRRRVWRLIREEGYWQGEVVNRRRDGSLYSAWMTFSAVRNGAGEVTHYVGTLSDISREKEAQREIHRLAYFDPLTDLPNRRLLHDRIEHALAASRRSEEHAAVLLLDLDHFKKVNDSLGHNFGDDLLLQASERMRSALRAGDTLARFGGDEFVVLLEDLGSDAIAAGRHAERVGETLREALARRYQLGAQSLYCTASIGITLFRGRDATMESVLRHADLAMYRAKNAGRNSVRFFEPQMQTELNARNALETDLRAGLERGELVLHYQPQVDDDGYLIGAEALVRWNHPQRGLLAPGVFIGVAEETGLIVPLGLRVLEMACAQLRRWVELHERPMRLAVNVSSRQFRQGDFVESVLRCLRDAGVEASWLKLEITESLMLENIDEAVAKMDALQDA